MRAALLVVWSLAAQCSLGQSRAPTLAELSGLDRGPRETALLAVRNLKDGDAVLLDLETQLASKADARRAAGQPPLFPGCMRPDEYELIAQLRLARAAADGQTYQALAAEYRRLTKALRDVLNDAQDSGKWRKNFSHLGHWISDWSKAEDPLLRDLFFRTLIDQAIRASLSSFQGKKVYVVARPTPALRAYDEYLFNLMCTSDEENLRWLKSEVARNGWFDIHRYGKMADEAAWLMVQHADGDPNYQAYIASVLATKARTGDTNPQNYAFLSDHIAVRAGLAQTYATQMECVNNQWLAPKVVAPDQLDARRASVGLPTYAKQVAKRRNLYCGKGPVR